MPHVHASMRYQDIMPLGETRGVWVGWETHDETVGEKVLLLEVDGKVCAGCISGSEWVSACDTIGKY